MNGAETVAITGNTMVETQAQGIYVSGSRYVTITGNSIVRPSKNTDEHHAGMLLDSIRDCLISSNIVIDDRSVPEMTYGLQMTGDSRDNIVTNNRIGKGRDGGLDISGRDNNVDDNMVR